MAEAIKQRKMFGALVGVCPESGLLVPNANKIDIGGGGGLYVAGSQQERELCLNAAQSAYDSAIAGGLCGVSFRELFAEAAGQLAALRRVEAGKQIGAQAEGYIDWELSRRAAGVDSTSGEPDITPQATQIVVAFLDWVKANKVEPIISGRMLFNERDEYYVETAMVGSINGEPVAMTVVQGKEIRDKDLLINAAAVEAARTSVAKNIKSGYILRLAKYEDHIKDGGLCEVRRVSPEESKRNLHAFELALGLWKWKHNYARQFDEVTVEKLSAVESVAKMAKAK